MYIINLGYLEYKSLYFIELLDSYMEKLNKILIGLNTITIIPEIDN